jgi:hypothetical protein
MKKKSARQHNSCAALSDEAYNELVSIAKIDLDADKWIINATDALGDFASKGIGKASKLLPKAVSSAIQNSVSSSLTWVLTQANKGVAGTHRNEKQLWLEWVSGPWFHRIAAAASGAAGGSLGALTAAVDVGASTMLILRSVQEIAREYGEDLSEPEALADCLSVLAMGGPRSEDDDLDLEFWEIRLGLKIAIRDDVLLKTMNAGLKSPIGKMAANSRIIAKLVESEMFKKVADRFGVKTLEAFAGKAVPVIGALSGAYINYAYVCYYQEMAHVLYRLKKLEKTYDKDQVISCYMMVVSTLKEERR